MGVEEHCKSGASCFKMQDKKTGGREYVVLI